MAMDYTSRVSAWASAWRIDGSGPDGTFIVLMIVYYIVIVFNILII